MLNSVSFGQFGLTHGLMHLPKNHNQLWYIHIFTVVCEVIYNCYSLLAALQWHH
jgi:hypothetical protein